MKTLLTLVGLAISCVLSGCAHDTSTKAASKPEAVTVVGQTASFMVTSTGTTPLSYQWNIIITNTPAVAGNPNGSWQLFIVDATNNLSK